MKRFTTMLLSVVALAGCGESINQDQFTLSDQTGVMQIYVDENQPKPIHKAVKYLSEDIEMISGKEVEVVNSTDRLRGGAIIVGLHDDKVVRDAQNRGVFQNNSELDGARERFAIKSVDNLFGRGETSVIISGSDALGTAYGVLEFSQRMGVSPLYWWCDSHDQRNARW